MSDGTTEYAFDEYNYKFFDGAGKLALLSIVTAGGYGVYYWYRQMKEVETIEINQMHKSVDKNIPFILFLLLYYLSATIAGFVFVVIYYQRLVVVAKEVYDIDLKPKDAFIYALLMYVPIYSWYLSVKNHNKVIAMYNYGNIVSEPMIQQIKTPQKPIYNPISKYDVYPNDQSVLDAANAGLDDI